MEGDKPGIEHVICTFPVPEQDWREFQWMKLVLYLPYENTQTCAFCGRHGISADPRRIWSIAFMHHFLSSVCRPSPFVYTVLMSMVYRSLKNKTWRSDRIVLCKDCMDWAKNICVYDESNGIWRMVSSHIKFKRRGTKLQFCAYLPMDLLIMFLHAPSENRQLEYRMMKRLLRLLALPAEAGSQCSPCLYSGMPFHILRAVIHCVRAGTIQLCKVSKLQDQPTPCSKYCNDGCSALQQAYDDWQCKIVFHHTSAIATNVAIACHIASGQKQLVRNAPDVAKYIRKCSSLLDKEDEKKKSWQEWYVTGL